MAWHVTTPSHAGIWVTAQGMQLIAPAFQKNRTADGCGWFEDDEFAIPYVALDLHQYHPVVESRAHARAVAVNVLTTNYNATPEDVRAKK